MGSISTLPKRAAAQAPIGQRQALMTPAEVSAYLKIAVRTLANWRCAGGGPEFVKVGDTVRYRESAVEAWLDARRVSA